MRMFLVPVLAMMAVAVSASPAAAAVAVSTPDNLQDIKFSISVQDITKALSGNHTGHPLEQLICDKILALFAKANITIQGGSLVYDDVGPQLEVSSKCSHTVWLEQGWETTATLKPDTSVSVDFRLNGFTIVVETDLLLDCDFGVAAHLRLREGVHDPFDHHKCKDIAVETTHASVGGDMKLQTNLTLELKPRLVKNTTGTHTSYSIAFTPTVHLAGDLAYFHPTASSSIKIFGIDIKFIEDDINKYIESAMQKEVSQHQIQKEFAKLQTELQAIADKIWDPSVAVGSLPDIQTDPKYLTMMEDAITNIVKMQTPA
eukprot:CAMPEP_0175158810 /NCGR_PEP_ID=MMETSP0087-20121206/23038_1 /TAXON_ID=136419 /ORGANISM="Unknown Unknown, Strain D1" /LENGTH=315 /DNA_ID=CAMNT_0016446719 /DNA_START=36 /DNA_END=983 /DNA_ORIENTATION=+